MPRNKLQRFTASDVAKLVGCHPNTVRRLADLGLIQSSRDFNGWRVFLDINNVASEVLRLLCGSNQTVDAPSKQSTNQEGGEYRVVD